ncbi:MAG: O-methyltransferase [Chitinophagales bacterium]|nr:O-methyltransferase [Chitinophagales bacterium]
MNEGKQLNKITFILAVKTKKMDILPLAIEQYAEQYSTPENAVLAALNRETYAKVLMPRMLSGHLQGTYLSMLSHMLSPNKILEIGTFTGYSAICLAAGLTESGKLYTIDINEELAEMVNSYIDKANLQDKIIPLVGNAMDIIPNLDETFDLVFIDADKINYANYYDLVFDKVRTGGFIVADNVLWSGKVLEGNMDKDTKAIHEYNEKIHADSRVVNMILPIRDGISIARKIV